MSTSNEMKINLVNWNVSAEFEWNGGGGWGGRETEELISTDLIDDNLLGDDKQTTNDCFCSLRQRGAFRVMEKLYKRLRTSGFEPQIQRVHLIPFNFDQNTKCKNDRIVYVPDLNQRSD